MNKPDTYRAAMRPLDMAIIGYLAIQFILLLIFGGNLSEIAPLLGLEIPLMIVLLMFYAAAAAIVLILALFPVPIPSPLWRALRLCYPVLLFSFLYEAVGPQVFMIFDKPFDPHIIAFEKALFGADPAFILQSYMEIWLNELMNFSYISYYIIVLGAIVLLLLGKRWLSLERAVLAISISFYLSYLIFIFCPVVGPRFFLEDYYYLPMIGPVFTPLAARIVQKAGLYGGAMPSSHCAVALAAVWIMAAEFKKIRYYLIGLLVLLCMSTVYARYHYVSDVVVGLVLGWASLKMGDRWLQKYYRRRHGGSIEMAAPEGARDSRVPSRIDNEPV